MGNLYVLNSGGDKESFSPQKVYRSARRVGASRKLAQQIVEAIETEAYPGMKTSEIFQRVENFLHREAPAAAVRFNLKEGMRRLGPSGFPFEKFVGEVFKRLGFAVELNLYLPGFCLGDYEIDFLAQKDNLVYVGECKYRNVAGEKVHTDDVLANHARFLDLLKGPYFKSRSFKGCQIRPMMVTNEKFTARAIAYCFCQGIELLGWKHPKGRGLESLIEEKNLYPLTILSSLKGYLKDVLVSRNIMLVEDLLKTDPETFSRRLKLSPKHLYSIIREAKLLLGS